jgi:hypothetical protein
MTAPSPKLPSPSPKPPSPTLALSRQPAAALLLASIAFSLLQEKQVLTLREHVRSSFLPLIVAMGINYLIYNCIFIL